MQNGSLPAPNLYPFANSAEFFYGDSATGAFSAGNDLLRYYVIGVAGEALFLAGQFLQAAIGRCRVLLLQLRAQAALTVAHALDFASAIHPAIRIGGNVRDAQIDAEESIGARFWLCHFTRGRKVKRAVAKDQIALALLALEQLQLRIAREERDMQPAGKGPDRDGLLAHMPSQNTGVVSNRARGLERPHDLLIQLVAVGDLRNTAHHNLGGQRELLAGSLVHETVDIELPEALSGPRALADPVAALVGLCQRVEQAFRLIVRGCEFHFRGQLHCLYSALKPLYLLGSNCVLRYFSRSKNLLKDHRLKAVVSDLEFLR